MKLRVHTLPLSAFLLAFAASTAVAGDARPTAAAPDAAMKSVLDAYFRIHDALASDRVDGVGAAARDLAKAAGKLKIPPLKADLLAAALKVEKARELPDARTAMRGLSERLATWADGAKGYDLQVLSCDMAHAKWLQRAAEPVRNPYYGSEMLACGEVIKKL